MELSDDGSVLIRVLDTDIFDGKFVIPESVTQIGDSAFLHCGSLIQITIPDSVTQIGDRAFFACPRLTEIIIPESVTQIGDSAFAGCSGLIQITLPDSVTQIGDLAFYRCSSLTEIIIPESVTYIGRSAFKNCTSLTQIILPNTVKHIEYEAFGDCLNINLEAIVIDDSDQKAFDRISRLVPQASRDLVIPSTLWPEIKKAKEQALIKTQPIGMSSFPLKTQEVVVNLVQQMEGGLHDVINQVRLPKNLDQLEQYKQNLQRALDRFKIDQDARHQRPVRIAVINKLRQLIKVNQETLQNVQNKTESFFNKPENILNLDETHARIALAGKLIEWLEGNKTIFFDDRERALLTKPRSSFALILENGGIDVEQLPKPPIMGL